MIRRLRHQHNWSQGELARRADLSERFIRKLETSKMVRVSSLRRVAEAFSTAGDLVEVEALMVGSADLLQRLTDTLLRDATAQDLQLDLAEKHAVTIHVSGDPRTIPFAGTYDGVAGFLEFRQRLAQSVQQFQVNAGTIERFTGRGKFSICFDACLTAKTKLKQRPRALTTSFVFTSISPGELRVHTDTEAVARFYADRSGE